MNTRLPPNPTMQRIALSETLAGYERAIVAMVAECPPGVLDHLHALSISQVVILRP